MATTYTTLDGDMLDQICVHHYGLELASSALIAVLDANAGLADAGAIYSAGLTIVLPEIVAEVKTSEWSLWD